MSKFFTTLLDGKIQIMKTLYFVRHGESIFNKSSSWVGSSIESPLTELGISQAKQTASDIISQGLKFDLIISSPLIRALDTATIICNIIQYPIKNLVIDPNITERNFGILEGNKDMTTELEYAKSELNIDNIQGVEKVADLQKRADEFYKYLRTLSEENILIVGHGAFGRALSRSINNIPITKRHLVLKNGELAKFI